MTRRPGLARCRTGHALLAFLTALGVLLVSQGVGASPALAHNSLVKTVPADGVTLEAVPAEIRLVFDQPAPKVGTQILITGPQGRVEQGEVQLIDNDVRQAIGPDAPAGRYEVLWRVTSDDGHPVTGDFSFTAKQAGGSTATGPSTAGKPRARPLGRAAPATPVTKVAPRASSPSPSWSPC